MSVTCIFSKPPKNWVWRCFIYFSDLSSIHHLSFVYSLQLKNTNTFIWYFPLVFFFFCRNLFLFLNWTGMVLYVFYWDLMVSWLHLMFQVFKCFKWRVQPQTSFLTSKKSSLAMLYLFFWAFCSSSSSILLLFFFSRYPFFFAFSS